MDPVLNKIRKIISNSEHIAVVSGLEVVIEAGLNGVRAEHIAYDIEQQFGYSNDEIISSLFYSRRVELFYQYYRDIILNKELELTPVHKGIAKLQAAGKLDAVITRTVYSLHQAAGCKNVIELHGSVEENHCTNCGKIFGSQYIRNAKGVPSCDECGIPLRPGFTLLGEMVDNGKMTQASNAIEKAEVLLIIGAGLNSALCRHLLKYYKGKKMILLNVKEAVGDEKADYRAYGNLSEMLTYIIADVEEAGKQDEQDKDKICSKSNRADACGES